MFEQSCLLSSKDIDAFEKKHKILNYYYAMKTKLSVLCLLTHTGKKRVVKKEMRNKRIVS